MFDIDVDFSSNETWLQCDVIQLKSPFLLSVLTIICFFDLPFSWLIERLPIDVLLCRQTVNESWFLWNWISCGELESGECQEIWPYLQILSCNRTRVTEGEVVLEWWLCLQKRKHRILYISVELLTLTIGFYRSSLLLWLHL